MSRVDLPASDPAARQVLVRKNLEAALQSGREQFQLALQPIVDAASGAVLNWEVLVRWSHPVLGDISPGEFIPIAESTGLIEAVGDLVLEAALRHLTEIPPSRELVGREVSLSVNVSPLQLIRPGFAAEIGAMLDARGLDHRRLCLEVTEAVFANVEAVATISEIRRLGVLVAIDAFGIGNSSLSRLERLPADVVKLDRSFLPELDAVITGGRSFLTAVIDIAHSAGLRAVVEGVENQVQLNAVVAAGADGIQGYLLGVPMRTAAALAVDRETNEEHAWQPKFVEASRFAAGAPLAAESPGILERLRGCMGDADASVDAVPTWSRLLGPNLSAPEYLETLRRLHAFKASMAPRLAGALRGRSGADVLLDGVALAALAADIAWFGAVPLEPRHVELPDLDESSGLGALYVIEGSNLDARIVGRQVANTLGVGPGTGGSFYCGLTAEDARRRWRLLQEVLRVEIDAADQPWEPVAWAAQSTFEALDLWMRERA